jgi:basic amino acid/polyamine antiporter, APA family
VREERPTLRPVLGRWQLLGLGIGTIIGSGVFVIPGPAAALFAGPAIILSFLVAAFGCALAGLCYAELSAMFPAAGSAYAYASRAFGRRIGWLIGWLLILEYLFSASIVAEACAAYALGAVSATDTPLVALLKSLFPSVLLVVVAWPVVWVWKYRSTSSAPLWS